MVGTVPVAGDVASNTLLSPAIGMVVLVRGDSNAVEGGLARPVAGRSDPIILNVEEESLKAPRAWLSDGHPKFVVAPAAECTSFVANKARSDVLHLSGRWIAQVCQGIGKSSSFRCFLLFTLHWAFTHPEGNRRAVTCLSLEGYPGWTNFRAGPGLRKLVIVAKVKVVVDLLLSK